MPLRWNPLREVKRAGGGERGAGTLPLREMDGIRNGVPNNEARDLRGFTSGDKLTILCGGQQGEHGGGGGGLTV
jgi:hypothetical protein